MARTRVLAAVALLLALALAGCADDAEQDGPAGPGASAGAAPPLEGWVFDAALRPLPGVEVAALEQGLSIATDRDGHYVFEDLPFDQPVIVAASQAGFQAQTKQVTLRPDLPAQLNFTLIPVPVKMPTREVFPFNGFLACQVSVVAADDEVFQDCGEEGNDDTFRFTAGPDLAGIVVEVAWTAGTELSRSLYASVAVAGGDVIAEAVGGSVLRVQVAEQIARSRLPEGGELEVHVRLLPATDEEESAVGAGLVVSQEFQVFASLFYVEPPSPNYTVQEP